MAAPTNAALVKKVLANSEPSTHGPQRHFAAPNNYAAIGVTTDIDRHGYWNASVVNDPLRKSSTTEARAASWPPSPAHLVRREPSRCRQPAS